MYFSRRVDVGHRIFEYAVSCDAQFTRRDLGSFENKHSCVVTEVETTSNKVWFTPISAVIEQCVSDCVNQHLAGHVLQRDRTRRRAVSSSDVLLAKRSGQG